MAPLYYHTWSRGTFDKTLEFAEYAITRLPASPDTWGRGGHLSMNTFLRQNFAYVYIF